MQLNQLLDTIMLALDSALANVHTATVAKVTAVNASTINCQPVMTRVVNGQSIELPEFAEVPPVVLQGGGSYTAYPIAVGDYCLLIFTERCFDRWYHGQDDLPPLEARMHDYSDGFAIVGINPLAGAVPIPATIEQIGEAHYTGPQVIVGDVTVTGNVDVDGEVTANGIALSTHIHPDPQGGSTGGPQ